jgi:arylsulfatase A-like enzyme
MIKTNAFFTIVLFAGANMFPTIANEKPNVIIIYNDDMGYQDLGCFGAPIIKTPRVDQLAKEGIRFSNFYSSSPVCSASRATLLTGCYPQRVGVPGVISAGSPQGLNPEHVTIAEILKSAGYSTAAVGKWHLGDQIQHLPTNQGFDSYFGIPYSNDMFPSRHTNYAHNCLWRNGFSLDSLNRIFAKLEPDNIRPMSVKENVPLLRNQECIEFPVDQTTLTRRYADEGIQFIQKSVRDKKPFFLYLANSMPHVPLFVSPEFAGKSKQGLYGDVIEEIDYNTGRILDKLMELGIVENTIVIFSSDNGPWLSKGEHSGSALPLFEGKFTSFEGGMRVPCIVRWPKEIPSGLVCNELAATMDVLPTLASISGANYPEKEIDGKSILDLWKGKPEAKTKHEYYFYIGNGQAVRWGDWKYHKKEIFQVKGTARKTVGPTLYNLNKDLGESKNVITEHPEIAERLAKALEEHLNRIGKK